MGDSNQNERFRTYGGPVGEAYRACLVLLDCLGGSLLRVYVFGFIVFWFGLEVVCSFWTTASVPTFDIIFGNNHVDGVLVIVQKFRKTN